MTRSVAGGVGMLIGVGGCLAVLAAQQPPASTAEPDPAQIAAGKRLFADTCQNDHCHGGSARNMEDHSGFTAQHLRQVIKEGVPDAGMQSFEDVFTPEQVEQLVAYILSVSADHGASAANRGPQPASAHTATTHGASRGDAAARLTRVGSAAAWSDRALDPVIAQPLDLIAFKSMGPGLRAGAALKDLF